MSLSDLHVMLVEGQGFQRRLGLRLLSDLGLSHLYEAGAAAQALGQLRAMPEPPQVLLVDLAVPDMDGVEFVGLVAQERLARSVALLSPIEPVWMNSLQANVEAVGLRLLGWLDKPFTPGKLTRILSLYEDDGTFAPDLPAGVGVGVEEMRLAFAQERIEPWFLPQARLTDGAIVGVEASPRLRRADGVCVPDSDLVPAIEAAGLCRELSLRLLLEGCRWLRRWKSDGMSLRLSINVSAQGLSNPEFADRCEAMVRERGVDPAQIVFEIAEAAVMSGNSHSQATLTRLGRKGFGLSVDHFGTGYSSLAQLAQFPFTELKIARDFVTGAAVQPRKRTMLESSLDLARRLGITAVADGVQALGEWRLLARLECALAQGDLISPAVPGDRLPDAIRNWRENRR